MSEISPMDSFNGALRENVRPPDHKNPVPKEKYGLVVIGAGTAGLVAASIAASLGARTALIEKNLMGGDCLNYGCVPSKSIISPSRIMAIIKNAGEFGIKVKGDVSADFGKVMKRMRDKRARISMNDSVHRFTQLGVDVFLGQGSFIDGRTVEVNGAKMGFEKAIITAGAGPATPDIINIGQTGFLTNETIFNLTKKPGKLLVMGGGPLGCELAQAFNRLGVKVALIQMGGHILDREDPDAAAIIQKKFIAEGIDLILNAKIIRAEKAGKKKRVYYETNGKEKFAEADELLAAAGRAPNVAGLGLENAGVRYDPVKGVHVDDRLRTSNSRIFAAGDICSPLKFTHLSDFHARIAVQNALFAGMKKASALTIPWCTYTSPEIAHTGMYERDAAAKGIAADTFRVEFSDVDRAIVSGAEEGFVKILVKKGTDRILGATIVSENAGDLISEITLAIDNGIGLGKIASVIHPYPTMAEAIRKAGDMYNKSRLTPLVKKVLGFIAGKR